MAKWSFIDILVKRSNTALWKNKQEKPSWICNGVLCLIVYGQHEPFLLIYKQGSVLVDK